MLSGAFAGSAAFGLIGPEIPTAAAAPRATVAQVKNLNHIKAGSNPSWMTDVGSTAFFTAYKPGTGTELWKSNGTSGGSVLVKNIDAGPSGSYPAELTNVGGELYFTANDGSTGVELWKSDGTAAGTVEVKNIDPGAASSSPGNLTNVGGTLFFTAFDATHGTELWKSTGTASGTVLVDDIEPGSGGSYPGNLTNVGGELFFSANNGTNGVQLWKSDGTTIGTSMVKLINASGSAISSESYPSSEAIFANVGGTLYFAANDGTHGTELWKSNGSPGGTVLVHDIYSGSSNSLPQYLTEMGGNLFFTAVDGVHGRELWEVNTTTTATSLVSDIDPGSSSSYPERLTPVGGKLFFSANDGTHGKELWETNGSATNLVKDINPGGAGSYPYSLTNVNGTLLFSANDGVHGEELWSSNGTTASLVKDIRPGSRTGVGYGYYRGSIFANVAGTLFFAADDGTHGTELWKSNGTGAGTTEVKDINNLGDLGSYPGDPVNVKGTLFFTANDGTHGTELWKSKGTGASTSEVKDIDPGALSSEPRDLTNVGGELFFTATDGTHGSELWKSNGTSAGTVMVDDIHTGSGNSYPHELMNMGGKLFFVANDGTHGYQLWKSNGSAGGTVMVADINPTGSAFGSGKYGSRASVLTNVNGTLFFPANDGTHGFELWKSDGTSGGTSMVEDIRPGAPGSSPSNLTNFKGTLLFSANDGTHGYEMWKSNGASSGTMMVADLNPGSPSSIRRPEKYGDDRFTQVGGTLFFPANDGTHGYELWKTQGTSGSTVLVSDIHPGSNSSWPTELTNVGGKLYFSAWDGTHGYELWKSNGSSAGTLLVKDIAPGSASGLKYYGAQLTNVAGTLFFAANDGVHGTELWDSSGTAAGTVMVRDIRPGAESSIGSRYGYSYPTESTFTNVGGTLFFAANDGTTGPELWKAYFARPKCTLKVPTSKVYFHQPKSQPGHKAKKVKLDSLIVIAKCNQAVSEKLTGKLKETVTVKLAHGSKTRTRTFTLGPKHARVKANARKTYRIKLPRSALKGLEHGAKESVRFTLVASNGKTSSTTKKSVRRLHGV